ncbi:MAG: hypothetical protein J5529_12280 [Prevotella sp.]|nr:hypothetical protein [Prevotella sp.]
MRNDLKTRTLVQRFFDGETSLAEEQELYRLFREGNVPDDLLKYRELFAGFDQVRLPQQKPVQRNWWRMAGIAASIAILLTVFGTLFTGHNNDECVAYIYGRECNDKAIVMQQMRSALNEMGDFTTVDEQMKDIFSE